MKKNDEIKKRKYILKIFKSVYCGKCSGPCCRLAEFTVFNWELDRFHDYAKAFNFRKNKIKDPKIKRISMRGKCPFLNEKKGCVLEIFKRSLDCFSYPIFPMIKYGRRKNEMMVDGMMVHRSCLFASKISKDKKIVGAMKKFWEEKIKELTKEEVRQWFGKKENYWLDKNIIKIKND